MSLLTRFFVPWLTLELTVVDTVKSRAVIWPRGEGQGDEVQARNHERVAKLRPLQSLSSSPQKKMVQIGTMVGNTIHNHMHIYLASHLDYDHWYVYIRWLPPAYFEITFRIIILSLSQNKCITLSFSSIQNVISILWKVWYPYLACIILCHNSCFLSLISIN